MHDARRRLFTLLALLPALAWAELPAPLEARYELLRNDKSLGEASLAYRSDASGWRLESHSVGTRGSARLLGFKEHSVSEGEWLEGLPRPTSFDQVVRAALIDHGWKADFDWAAARVATRHKDGESSLELSDGAVDPLTLGLRIRAGLARGEDHWTVPMLDKDEIEANEFATAEEELIDTSLGCLATRRVDKVRPPENKRYTRTWYARDLGWAPVRVEHGKTGGNHVETRILSLSLDGKPVSARPPCEAPAG